MMSRHSTNPIFFNIKNKDWTYRTLPTPTLLRPITSHFALTPLPSSLKVDVIGCWMVAKWLMIVHGGVLRLNLLFGKWWYTNMFTNSNIQVSHTFIIIRLIAESILKFITTPEVRSLGIRSLKWKLLPNLALTKFQQWLKYLVFVSKEKTIS